jgi:hypothetical protein
LLGEGIFAGKKRTFLLDSGCSLTRVDKPIVKKFKTIGELDVELEDEYLGRITNSEVILLDRVELGGAVFSNQPALPLNMVMGGRGVNFQVVLGADFLLRNNCLIDCLDGRLYCRESRTPTNIQQALDDTLRQSGYHEVKIKTGEGIIMSCEVKINGQSVPMVVDTGANNTGIDDNVAASIGLKARSRNMKTVGFDGIGVHEEKLAQADTFQVGDVVLEKMVLGVTTFENWHIAENSSTNRVLQGLLGADFLGENQALIDFRHKRMWLRPPEKKSK